MGSPHKWLDKHPILDPEHVHDLETRAAIGEFHSHKPRHQAEAEAFESYKKDHLTEAAAHHYVGLKAAHAAGDMEQAKKHGAMYTLALKALGHDNNLEVPPEVENKAKHLDKGVYRFKAHKGDAYSIPEEKTEKSELAKGVLQRLAPFNPQSMNDDDRLATATWQTEAEGREDVPRMIGPARIRALHKLSKKTPERRDPGTGERQFLLHRGMSAQEHRGALREGGGTGVVNHEAVTSWTPDLRTAQGFATDYRGSVVSAWVNARHIHAVPNQWGDLGNPNISSFDEHEKPKGDNAYRHEQEVMIRAGHSSKAVGPNELYSLQNPNKTLDGRINARTGQGSSFSRAGHILSTATPEFKRKTPQAHAPLPKELLTQMGLPHTDTPETPLSMVPKATFKV